MKDGMVESTEYRVAIEREEGFLKQMSKFKKKADKLGLDLDFSYKRHDKLSKAKQDVIFDGEVSSSYEYLYATYTVSHKPLILTSPEGIPMEWKTSLKFDSDNDMPVFYGGKQSGVDFESLEKIDRHRCDHCHTRRKRNNFHVFAEAEASQAEVERVIGASCSELYFGLDSASSLKEMMRLHQYLDGLDNEYGELPYAKPDYVDVEVFLTHVADTIDLSVRVGSDEVRVVASEAMAKSMSGQKSNNPVAVKLAEDAMTAAKEMECTNSFERNLRNIAKYGAVSFKNAVIGAWIVAKHAGDIQRENAKKLRLESSCSDWIGKEKERMDFNVHLTRIFSRESMYGEQYYYHFQDEGGNELVWKASKYIEQFYDQFENSTLENRGRFKIKATVIGHSEYEGVKQTNINRAKILSAPAIINESKFGQECAI